VDFWKSVGNPKEIYPDCGNLSEKISRAWELIRTYVQSMGNSTNNIFRSGRRVQNYLRMDPKLKPTEERL
jgi:hypothetical protein